MREAHHPFPSYILDTSTGNASTLPDGCNVLLEEPVRTSVVVCDDKGQRTSTVNGNRDDVELLYPIDQECKQLQSNLSSRTVFMSILRFEAKSFYSSESTWGIVEGGEDISNFRFGNVCIGLMVLSTDVVDCLIFLNQHLCLSAGEQGTHNSIHLSRPEISTLDIPQSLGTA